MNEKLFKKLGRVGAAEIALGVIVLVTGVAAGVISIICGAKNLGIRRNIMI